VKSGIRNACSLGTNGRCNVAEPLCLHVRSAAWQVDDVYHLPGINQRIEDEDRGGEVGQRCGGEEAPPLLSLNLRLDAFAVHTPGLGGVNRVRSNQRPTERTRAGQERQQAIERPSQKAVERSSQNVIEPQYSERARSTVGAIVESIRQTFKSFLSDISSKWGIVLSNVSANFGQNIYTHNTYFFFQCLNVYES
jgi:hypothetical protein